MEARASAPRQLRRHEAKIARAAALLQASASASATCHAQERAPERRRPTTQASLEQRVERVEASLRALQAALPRARASRDAATSPAPPSLAVRSLFRAHRSQLSQLLENNSAQLLWRLSEARSVPLLLAWPRSAPRCDADDVQRLSRSLMEMTPAQRAKRDQGAQQVFSRAGARPDRAEELSQPLTKSDDGQPMNLRSQPSNDRAKHLSPSRQGTPPLRAAEYADKAQQMSSETRIPSEQPRSQEKALSCAQQASSKSTKQSEDALAQQTSRSEAECASERLRSAWSSEGECAQRRLSQAERMSRMARQLEAHLQSSAFAHLLAASQAESPWERRPSRAQLLRSRVEARSDGVQQVHLRPKAPHHERANAEGAPLISWPSSEDLRAQLLRLLLSARCERAQRRRQKHSQQGALAGDARAAGAGGAAGGAAEQRLADAFGRCLRRPTHCAREEAEAGRGAGPARGRDSSCYLQLEQIFRQAASRCAQQPPPASREGRERAQRAQGAQRAPAGGSRSDLERRVRLLLMMTKGARQLKRFLRGGSDCACLLRHFLHDERQARGACEGGVQQQQQQQRRAQRRSRQRMRRSQRRPAAQAQEQGAGPRLPGAVHELGAPMGAERAERVLGATALPLAELHGNPRADTRVQQAARAEGRESGAGLRALPLAEARGVWLLSRALEAEERALRRLLATPPTPPAGTASPDAARLIEAARLISRSHHPVMGSR